MSEVPQCGDETAREDFEQVADVFDVYCQKKGEGIADDVLYTTGSSDRNDKTT